MIKYYALSVAILLYCNCNAQETKFEEVLELFSIPKNPIPDRLASEYFEFSPSESASTLYADKILARTEKFILLITYQECSVDDKCTRSFVNSFDLQGRRIDKILYKNTIADCSFDDKRDVVFVSKDLLVFKEVRKKLDCQNDKEQIGIRKWLEFQPIREDGKFLKPYTETKAIERENIIFSHRVFTVNELKEKTEQELSIIKNEIFASHGYMFETKKWIDYFESKHWYIPSSADVLSKLTDIEKQNIELIISIKNDSNSN